MLHSNYLDTLIYFYRILIILYLGLWLILFEAFKKFSLINSLHIINPFLIGSSNKLSPRLI